MSLNPIFRYVPSKGCHTEYISDSKGHKNKYLIFLSIIITHNDEKGNDASISDPVCMMDDVERVFWGKVGGRGRGGRGERGADFIQRFNFDRAVIPY